MAAARAKRSALTRSTTPPENSTTTNSPRKHVTTVVQPATPQFNRSPIRKRAGVITQAQKKALIDNLRLEITERSRRLRAQYNLQAQSLRTRVEIRLNRIPVSLRKLTMSELIQRHIQQQERAAQIAAKVAAGAGKGATATSQRTGHKPVPLISAPPQSARRYKPPNNTIPPGGNKENDANPVANTKKRVRGKTVTSESAPVLSPTDTNSRIAPRSRPTSPTKSSMSRSASPVKTSRPNIISNMVEKAKTTRAAITRKNTAPLATPSNPGASNTGSQTRRVAATPSKPAPLAQVPTNTRAARRASGDSNTSASEMIKKPQQPHQQQPQPTSRPGTAMSKSSTSSRGKTSTASTASKKAAMAAKTGTPKEPPKRVLRSRAA